jgi:hypothetical protein
MHHYGALTGGRCRVADGSAVCKEYLHAYFYWGSVRSFRACVG